MEAEEVVDGAGHLGLGATGEGAVVLWTTVGAVGHDDGDAVGGTDGGGGLMAACGFAQEATEAGVFIGAVGEADGGAEVVGEPLTEVGFEAEVDDDVAHGGGLLMCGWFLQCADVKM